jgi:hypothetical protein
LTKLQENAGRCIISQIYDSRPNCEESRFAVDCKPGHPIPKRSITRSITRDAVAPDRQKGPRGFWRFPPHRSALNFKNGGDLEQIKFLLGQYSIQTTERYLGSGQEIAVAVNENLGL